MSTVIVLAPLIVAGWPAITAAVTAAVATMGFSIARAGVLDQRLTTSENRAEIEVENSEVLLGSAGTGQEIVVEREGVRAIFTRDPRGALKICMEGKGYSKSELKKIGEELLGRVTQQYVYHRIVTELKERNMSIVDEEIAKDRTVKIRVRNF
jgi:hypothetical protein